MKSGSRVGILGLKYEKGVPVQHGNLISVVTETNQTNRHGVSECKTHTDQYPLNQLPSWLQEEFHRTQHPDYVQRPDRKNITCKQNSVVLVDCQKCQEEMDRYTKMIENRTKSFLKIQLVMLFGHWYDVSVFTEKQRKLFVACPESVLLQLGLVRGTNAATWFQERIKLKFFKHRLQEPNIAKALENLVVSLVSGQEVLVEWRLFVPIQNWFEDISSVYQETKLEEKKLSLTKTDWAKLGQALWDHPSKFWYSGHYILAPSFKTLMLPSLSLFATTNLRMMENIWNVAKVRSDFWTSGFCFLFSTPNKNDILTFHSINENAPGYSTTANPSSGFHYVVLYDSKDEKAKKMPNKEVEDTYNKLDSLFRHLYVIRKDKGFAMEEKDFQELDRKRKEQRYYLEFGNMKRFEVDRAGSDSDRCFHLVLWASIASNLKLPVLVGRGEQSWSRYALHPQFRHAFMSHVRKVLSASYAPTPEPVPVPLSAPFLLSPLAYSGKERKVSDQSPLIPVLRKKTATTKQRRKEKKAKEKKVPVTRDDETKMIRGLGFVAPEEKKLQKQQRRVVPKAVYWERQTCMKCGKHAINSLFQKEITNEKELKKIGKQLDDEEAKLLGLNPEEQSKSGGRKHFKRDLQTRNYTQAGVVNVTLMQYVITLKDFEDVYKKEKLFQTLFPDLADFPNVFSELKGLKNFFSGIEDYKVLYQEMKTFNAPKVFDHLKKFTKFEDFEKLQKYEYLMNAPQWVKKNKEQMRHISPNSNAFIFNKNFHWFAVRKFDTGVWVNLDSQNSGPKEISELQIAALTANDYATWEILNLPDAKDGMGTFPVKSFEEQNQETREAKSKQKKSTKKSTKKSSKKSSSKKSKSRKGK